MCSSDLIRGSLERLRQATGKKPAGCRLGGPAVVEEFGSTTVVFPNQLLEVDPHGILIVRSAGEPQEAR